MEPSYPMSCIDVDEDLVRPRRLEFAGQMTGEKIPGLKGNSEICRDNPLEYLAEY